MVDQTVVDPDRAPGGAATFKILTIAPYERADGRDWAEAKDEHAEALIKRVGTHAGGLSTGDILAVRAESPVDVAAHNPFNLGGSCHGGEFVAAVRRGDPGLDRLRHRRTGTVPHRRHQPPGRVGVRPTRPQRRPRRAHRRSTSTPRR